MDPDVLGTDGPASEMDRLAQVAGSGHRIER
jgi:hypothetical protein